ncbi:MAG TPA: hypothetical protein VFE65_17785 [Pseudonocardia sp.]|jgi:hypothetical protein|nr:hypothetical protein [Pseudonocardia sp.]
MIEDLDPDSGRTEEDERLNRERLRSMTPPRTADPGENDVPTPRARQPE